VRTWRGESGGVGGQGSGKGRGRTSWGEEGAKGAKGEWGGGLKKNV
jgi:hypothetical protein